jgi:hypothetical protein
LNKSRKQIDAKRAAAAAARGRPWTRSPASIDALNDESARISTPCRSEPPYEQHEAVPTKIRVQIDAQPVKLRPPPHTVVAALIRGVDDSKSAPSRGVCRFEARLKTKCAAHMPMAAMYLASKFGMRTATSSASRPVV